MTMIAGRRAPVARAIYRRLGGGSPLLANTEPYADGLILDEDTSIWEEHQKDKPHAAKWLSLHFADTCKTAI